MSDDLAVEEAALEAKLEMVRLERELVEAKAAGAANLSDLKHQVREARRVYRTDHRAATAGDGDGVAEPDPIAGSMTVVEG